MSKVMEERINDTEERAKINFAVRLIKHGKLSIEEIAELAELSIEIIKQIEEELKSVPA